MQLVVEISEDTFFDLKKKQNRTEVDNAVLNGTPLPKGRMIILSEDVVKREQVSLSFSCQKWISEVGLSNATVAIIEADTEVRNNKCSEL